MKKYRRKGLFIFIFFAAVYSIFSIGHFGGDGYEDYLTAESIVLDGNLSLADRPSDPDELGYKDKVGVVGRDGKVYSSRGSLGVPVLLAPFYAAGHFIAGVAGDVPHDYVTIMAVSFLNPLVSALSAFMIFLMSGRLGFGKRTAAALAFIYGLSTMAPVYARTGFGEPAAGALLLLSVYWLIRYASGKRTRDILFSGVFSAACILSKPVMLIFMPVLFAYFIWITFGKERPEKREVLAGGVFLLAAGMGSALVFFLNYTIYGKMLSLGAYDIADTAARIAGAKHFIKGVYYYLISTGKGFFIYNLPLVISLAVAGRMIREKNKEGVLFLAIFLVNLLFYVKSFRRGSLFSWGPRYLFVSVPFLVFLVGYYLETVKGFFGKALVWALSTAGFLMILPCMLINQSKFYFFVVEKLGLDEYMVNFIPDLCPVKGAWDMLIGVFVPGKQFVFSPDWRLVQPVAASMDGYNYVDLWFTKAASFAPSLAWIAWAGVGVLFLAAVMSLWVVMGPDED